MIILSNCLTDTVDEGSRKVAVNLVKGIRKQRPDTTVITYENAGQDSAIHLSLNKFLLNRKLLSILKKKNEPLLYIPLPAKSMAMAIRLLVLSMAARKGMTVIITMPFALNGLSKWLFRRSRAKIVTLNDSSCQYYTQVLGGDVDRLCVGVDTGRFCPIDPREKEMLRKKFELPSDKPIVLHVGHLNHGRNVEQLLKLDDGFHGVLVVSTQTKHEQDQQLRQVLLEKENLTLIDQYIPEIQQIYQLSDVYLFPVLQEQSCIDSPLSALEAAACGIPVVTTEFGEMKKLSKEEGFYLVESFAQDKLNALLQQAVAEKKNPRAAVMEYDWNNAVQRILLLQDGILEQEKGGE